MRNFGFCDQWAKLIMLCVKTVSYSILINGKPKGLIRPSLDKEFTFFFSPFLFLLCTKGFHALISQDAITGNIRGNTLWKSSTCFTHLLFANDSLLFYKATEQECQKILDILEVYRCCLGQHINENKTTIFFSKSNPKTIRDHIKEAFGVLKIKQYEKYLGLPSVVGRRKKAHFNYIKEKVWQKLQG